MRRTTRELTSIHYRRSAKGSISLDLQSQGPVCGSPLEAIVTTDAGTPQSGDFKVAPRIVFRVVQPGSGERSDKGSRQNPGSGSVVVEKQVE